MLTCIAIDDESLALELLEDNISKLPYLELKASFSDPLKAIAYLQENPVDLVFMDIQMPGLTGLQIIQSLRNKPMFVLITAYEKYALEGYSLDVIDYLVKPVPLDRFIKAAGKARELHQLRVAGKNAETKPDHFFIHVDYSLLKIVFADIMYVEALKDYVRIHLKSSSKHVIARMSMKNMEEELPASQFVRIHKSFIVSTEFITAVRKNSVFIGEREIPIGENYKDAIVRITGRKADE
ncbi:MAG: LytTR family DNA-binding domain-containing protein [Chitinophagaceae bacterium]